MLIRPDDDKRLPCRLDDAGKLPGWSDDAGKLPRRPDDAEEPQIRLIEIGTPRQLDAALQNPAACADRALYTTDAPECAKRLCAAGLPCIYRESGASGVYGVDLVICAEDGGQCADSGGRCGKADDRCGKDGGQCADSGGWRADDDLLRKVWQRHYHIPWTIARTERLWIRETVMEDLPAFLEIYGQERGNPDVKPFSDEPKRELESYIRERYPFFGYGLWSVEERATGRIVGRVGFEELTLKTDAGAADDDAADGAAGHAGAANGMAGDAERAAHTFLQLSYLIADDARRKGYAKEAARAVLAYAKENLAPGRIVLVTSRGNTASRRLALSLGFSGAGKLKLADEKIKMSDMLDKPIIYVYDL